MITLTKTMLEKSIIDCNKACREVALSCGVDFEKMAPGDRAVICGGFIGGPWTATEIRFYRTNNARGDRRISIKGLKQKASAGDVVRLRATKAGNIHVIIDGATS
jgi:hypothetical protein